MRKEAPDRLTQANAGGPALQDGKADDHRGTAVSTPSEQRDSIERGGRKAVANVKAGQVGTSDTQATPHEKTMKWLKALTVLAATILSSILCVSTSWAHTGVYAGDTHNQGTVADGAHTDILMGAPEFIETRVAGGQNFYFEGDELVVQVNVAYTGELAGDMRPADVALVSEGGAASAIRVTEAGQVDLVQDGIYGIYVYPGQRTGTVRIPIRRNNHPNETSTITVQLDHSRSWGIARVSTASRSIDIDDNDQSEPGEPLVITFCPGMPTEVREGQNYRFSLCLNRAADVNITGLFLTLAEAEGDLDTDLNVKSTRFVFHAGETRVEHSIPIYTDAEFEPDEQFDVFIQSTTGGVTTGTGIGTNLHTVTIKDNNVMNLKLRMAYAKASKELTVKLFVTYSNGCALQPGEDARIIENDVGFTTDTGEDLFRSDTTLNSRGRLTLNSKECVTYAEVKAVTNLRDDLYGKHILRATLETQTPGALGRVGTIAHPQGRTASIAIDFGPRPPPTLTPEEIAARLAARIAAAGPNIVTVSADKSEVEEGGTVTLTFTRNHAVWIHTRAITIGADSNIDVISGYGGCNSLGGIICIALGNLAVPTSLRFDDGVDTLQVTLYITNDDFIYSAGTISATVAQGTGDTGSTNKRVEVVLIDTDVETATEYTATFAPVETCVTVRGENSCTSGSANQSHRGKWERWVEVPIEFSAEPNAISYRDMIDRVAGGNLICGIVSAENGTMVGARRTAAPSNKRWVVRVHPETGAKDIILTIHRNGNPNAACDTRKITEFGETNMRLAASVTHTITRPPQITMADVTVSEDLRTLQCTRTHHDPVLDGDGNPVVDEDNNPVTTPRIENFERHNFPSHFVLTAILDKPAKNGLTLDFDEPEGWAEDVHYVYYPLPDLSGMSQEEIAAAVHRAECKNDRSRGTATYVSRRASQRWFKSSRCYPMRSTKEMKATTWSSTSSWMAPPTARTIMKATGRTSPTMRYG